MRVKDSQITSETLTHCFLFKEDLEKKEENELEGKN